jgi:hypothetical protein
VLGSQQPEVGARRSYTRSEMHQILVRDVAVGKHSDVDRELGNELLQILLFKNRYAIGIQAPRERRRINPARNVGNLCGCERSYPVVKVVAEENVEVVEVSARSAKQKDGFHEDLTALKLPCIFRWRVGLRLCSVSLAGVTYVSDPAPALQPMHTNPTGSREKGAKVRPIRSY